MCRMNSPVVVSVINGLCGAEERLPEKCVSATACLLAELELAQQGTASDVIKCCLAEILELLQHGESMKKQRFSDFVTSVCAPHAHNHPDIAPKARI
jgi:hypothetical protein